ncbi:MAG: T9SS type A sorting domain-containing protein [Bacteroidota bacterium]
MLIWTLSWNRFSLFSFLALPLALIVLLVPGQIKAQISPTSTETSKLFASNGTFDERFGWAISLDSNRVLIGAPTRAGDDLGAGSAYIYEFDGTNWTEIVKLTASDGANDDRFGLAVSLDGTRALVGAQWDEDKGEESGSAYLYEFDGTNWLEMSKLTASDGENFDLFGGAVALDGNHALIGVRGDNEAGSSGSVYSYQYDGNNWVEGSKLLPSNGSFNGGFGSSLSINGNQILIGASLENGNANFTGAAYIFEFDGSSWTEVARLVASDGATSDYFGRSVSLNGNVALVGAIKDGESGLVYVFEFDGSSWTEVNKLTASDGTADDGFGFSISLENDLAVVGAPAAGFGGAAYLFKNNGSSWTEAAKLTSSDGIDVGTFGFAVSVDRDLALIGAIGQHGNTVNTGASYVFELNKLTSIQQMPSHLITVQPNPFQNRLEIDWTNFPYPIDEIRLMSVEGKNVLIEPVSSLYQERYLLSTPNLPKGLYFLEIRSSKGRIVKRVTQL